MNNNTILGITFDEYAKLVSIYSDPSRHYHNINHIYRCLGILNDFKNSGVATEADFNLVSRAIWFHDSFYSPYFLKGENEELSAKMAIEEDSSFQAHILEEIILATAKHTEDQKFYDNLDAVRTQSIALMLDIDLTSMADSQKEFIEDGDKIRKEYSYVPEKHFLEARLAFFKKMFARKRLYYTPYFYDKYEAKCRENLNFGIIKIEENLKDF